MPSRDVYLLTVSAAPLLAALVVLWLASGTQRERAVIGVHSAEVASAEAAGCRVVTVEGVEDVTTSLLEPYFATGKQVTA